MLNINEIWKPLKDFEEYYEVSNNGFIRNKKTKCVLKTYTINSGYEALKLTVNRVRTSILVHRAVALTFIDNTEDKATVNHIDGDKSNNTLSNLEWATHSENNQHAFDLGLHNKEDCKSYVGLKHKNPASKYHNVAYDKSRGKWVSKVTHNGKNWHQKRFNTEEEAALHVNWIIDELGLQNERPKNFID